MKRLLIKFLGLEKLVTHVEEYEKAGSYQELHNKLSGEQMSEAFLSRIRNHTTLARDLNEYAKLSFMLGTFNDEIHEQWMKK